MSVSRTGMWVVALALCGAGSMNAQDPGVAPPSPQQQQAPGTLPENGGPGRGPGAGRRGGEGMQQRQLDRLTRQLQLNPTQVDQVKAIQADAMQQMMALRDDTATAQQDRRAKMMGIRQGEQSKIRDVLTEEQKTKFDAMQTRMQQRREDRESGPGAPPPPPPQPAPPTGR